MQDPKNCRFIDMSLPADKDMMLPISELWAGRLKKMGCPSEKITVSRMGVDMERFTQRPVKVPGKPLQIISVARLTEKKGLHVAIEACRQLKARGVDFHSRILGIGPWELWLSGAFEMGQKMQGMRDGPRD